MLPSQNAPTPLRPFFGRLITTILLITLAACGSTTGAGSSSESGEIACTLAFLTVESSDEALNCDTTDNDPDSDNDASGSEGGSDNTGANQVNITGRGSDCSSGAGEDCGNTNTNNDGDDNDGDGVADESDNCPAEANSDQADSDGDGIGDVCDDSPDGDETDAGDAEETAPEETTPAEADDEDAGTDVEVIETLNLNTDNFDISVMELEPQIDFIIPIEPIFKELDLTIRDYSQYILPECMIVPCDEEEYISADEFIAVLEFFPFVIIEEVVLGEIDESMVTNQTTDWKTSVGDYVQNLKTKNFTIKPEIQQASDLGVLDIGFDRPLSVTEQSQIRVIATLSNGEHVITANSRQLWSTTRDHLSLNMDHFMQENFSQQNLSIQSISIMALDTTLVQSSTNLHQTRLQTTRFNQTGNMATSWYH